jgi:hypothetical protein
MMNDNIRNPLMLEKSKVNETDAGILRRERLMSTDRENPAGRTRRRRAPKPCFEIDSARYLLHESATDDSRIEKQR